MEPLDLAVPLASGALVFLAANWIFLQQRRGAPLPPQPPGYPLIGNLIQMPTTSPWLKYLKWGKELNSDIVYVTAIASNFLIINSFETAVQLLDKRSGIYSSRPHSVLLDELMGWDFMLSRLPYGDAWRERRRLFHQHLRPQKESLYQHRILEHIRRSMIQHERRPTDGPNVIQHTVGGFAISLAYGLDIHPYEDPMVRFVEDSLGPLRGIATPGARLVNVFPPLKHIPAWFPGVKFKREALKGREISQAFRERPFRDAEAKIATSQGSIHECFASVTLEELAQSKDDHEAKREVIKDTLAIIYAAGSGTIATSLTTWICAMLLYPDVQRRVQKELDEVIVGRLPEFSDEESLPWLKASIMESMRICPVNPLAVAHSSTEDDVFAGYFIPKGTTIIPNVWAMLHDEKHYPDAMAYKPERFIKNNRIDPQVLHPNNMAFGFGRRQCPGIHIAEAVMFIAAGTILSIFDICKAPDEKGEAIEPKTGVLPGIISHVLPFRSVFKVRNKTAQSVLSNLESVYST